MIRFIIFALTLMVCEFGYAAEKQAAAYDVELNVRLWTVDGFQKPAGNELFTSTMIAREIVNGWTYDEKRGRVTQCNKKKHNCVSITCDMGTPKLLISDPENRGYRIRFWAMDGKRRLRTPLDIVDTKFDLESSQEFKESTVSVPLTEQLVSRMTFNDILRIAYSYPYAGIGVEKGANEIFIHSLMLSSNQADPRAWFKWCAQIAREKAEKAATAKKAEQKKAENKKKSNKKKSNKRRSNKRR